MATPTETRAAARTKQEVVKDFRTSEILEAARRVISEIGYSGASMEKVARAAGISKGTIYLYFKNKETLLAEAFRESFETFRRDVAAATEKAELHEDKVRELVRATFRHAEANQPFYRALQVGRPELGRSGDTEAAEEIFKEIEAFQQIITGVVERGIGAGVFRGLDSARCARFLGDLIRGVVNARLVNPDHPPIGESDIDALVDFFLHGIALERGAKGENQP